MRESWRPALVLSMTRRVSLGLARAGHGEGCVGCVGFCELVEGIPTARRRSIPTRRLQKLFSCIRDGLLSPSLWPRENGDGAVAGILSRTHVCVRIFSWGRGDESSPEDIPMVIHRLVHLLPREYRENLAARADRKSTRLNSSHL